MKSIRSFFLILPVALLAACNNNPAPDTSIKGTSDSSSQPIESAEIVKAPTFIALDGNWKLDIFGRAKEKDQLSPNLTGTITFKTEENNAKVSGTYEATVLNDQWADPEGKNRQFTYKITNPAFWMASKSWDHRSSTWKSHESISFTLVPKKITPEPDDGFPSNLDCQLFTSSRVEKPKSGKETYTLTCKTTKYGKVVSTLQGALEKQ